LDSALKEEDAGPKGVLQCNYYGIIGSMKPPGFPEYTAGMPGIDESEKI